MAQSYKHEIVRLLQTGVSYNEIAGRLGCSKATISYHARKLGRHTPQRRYDWPTIQAYYDAGHTMNQCRNRFGFSSDAWKTAVERGLIVMRDRRIPLEKLLVAGRGSGRRNLKERLLRAGLLEYRCYRCGITAWLDEPISLELHHINGNGDDNRLENLTLLCPNCHSQTPNYCGRNARKPRILRSE